MKLHNRQIKASFWTDPDLLQWSRDKRWFYMGLVQLADDSGCLEDSSFAFKIQLFPSPVDADITTDIIEKWRDEMAEAGKLIRYESAGKQCLYIANFHKHQVLKNCPAPDVPLPPWLQWEPYKSNERSGKYIINNDILAKFLQGSYSFLTDDLQSSSNLTKPNLTRTKLELEQEGGLGETSEGEHGETRPNNHPLNNHSEELKNTTNEEREILSVLKSIELYPFDFEKDLQFIRDLATDYPSLDLLYQVKKWRDYKRDKPLTQKSSPRAQLRNWMNKADEWRNESNEKTGRNTAGGPARADPAGKYRQFVRSPDMP